MSEHDLNWKYVDDSVVETESIAKARQQSLELGVEPVSPAVGAQLAVHRRGTRAPSRSSRSAPASASRASGCCRPRAARMLTSIDTENEYQQHARQHFADAGIAAGARAAHRRPRERGAAPHERELLRHRLRRRRRAVGDRVRRARPAPARSPAAACSSARALWKGRVADPARRDEAATAFRTLIAELAASTAVVTAISPAGDGLLQIVKLGA